MTKMNLILCGTPFQTLVAKRIIEQSDDDEQFFGLYVRNGTKSKDDHYSNMLRGICDDFLYIEDKTDYLNKLTNKDFKTYYFPLQRMIAEDVLHFFEANSFTDVKFYDDGAMSIIQGNQQINMQRNELTDKLLSLVSECVTIFPEENLTYFMRKFPIKRIKFLDDDFEEGFVTNNSEIKILAGTAFPFPKGEYQKMTEKICKDHQIEFCVPHPRFDFVPKGVKKIESELILEDIVKQLRPVFGKVTIYHFSSTVAFTLKDVSGVEVIGLKTPYTAIDYVHFQLAGCKYINA